MPLFEYQQQRPSGVVIPGKVEAASELAAIELLEEKGIKIVGIREVKEEINLLERISLIFQSSVSAKDLVVFFRQFSVMLSATVPIVQALKILTDQTTSRKLKSVVRIITDDVEGGARLSKAFAAHSDVFNDFYVNMIKAGETSGKIDEVLNYLANQTEKDYALKGQLRGAMIYPAFIISGMMVVGFVVMIYVVPNLTATLTEANVQLPLSTRILIASSSFLQKFWWVVFGSIGLSVFALRFAIKRPLGRLWWDNIKIKLPIFGKILRTIYLVRFTRSFSTLLIGGVPMTQALEIVAQVVGNAKYQDLILLTAREVKDGNPLATTLINSPLVPGGIGQMISIGEQTGKLDEVLERTTDFYTREVDSSVANMATLIEPIVMVILGLAVGTMIAAIILPMYRLAGSM